MTLKQTTAYKQVSCKTTGNISRTSKDCILCKNSDYIRETCEMGVTGYSNFEFDG